MKNNMPMAALIDALSLIDGISKVEYPSEKQQSIRYKKWWGKYKENLSIDEDTVYQIRCFVMHESKMLIKSEKVDILALSIDRECEGPFINTLDYLPDGRLYYRMDLYGFCNAVCVAYDDYYNTHKEQVDLADMELFVVNQKDIDEYNSNPEKAYAKMYEEATTLAKCGMLEEKLGHTVLNE